MATVLIWNVKFREKIAQIIEDMMDMADTYQWGYYHWRRHCPRSRRCRKKNCPYHCAPRPYSCRADSIRANDRKIISTVTDEGCCSIGCSVSRRPASDWASRLTPSTTICCVIVTLLANSMTLSVALTAPIFYVVGCKSASLWMAL